MKTNRFLLWSVASLFVLAAPVLAQHRAGPGRGMPRYNPATEISVKGTVEEVQQRTFRMNGGSGTHLLVKTDKGTLDVHLGPTRFLEEKKFSFAKGDEIEVVGSQVKIAGKEALLAREVKKGDQTLTLRNAQGIPQWSGGRRN